MPRSFMTEGRRGRNASGNRLRWRAPEAAVIAILERTASILTMNEARRMSERCDPVMSRRDSALRKTLREVVVTSPGR
jgi:hypothetical protein